MASIGNVMGKLTGTSVDAEVSGPKWATNPTAEEAEVFLNRQSDAVFRQKSAWRAQALAEAGPSVARRQAIDEYSKKDAAEIERQFEERRQLIRKAKETRGLLPDYEQNRAEYAPIIGYDEAVKRFPSPDPQKRINENDAARKKVADRLHDFNAIGGDVENPASLQILDPTYRPVLGTDGKQAVDQYGAPQFTRPARLATPDEQREYLLKRAELKRLDAAINSDTQELQRPVTTTGGQFGKTVMQSVTVNGQKWERPNNTGSRTDFGPHTPAAEPALENGKVKLVHPDGRMWIVPEEQAAGAEGQGFIRVPVAGQELVPTPATRTPPADAPDATWDEARQMWTVIRNGRLMGVK